MLASTRKGNWWDQAKVIVLLQTGDSNTTALLNVTGKYTFHRNTNTNTKSNTNTHTNTPTNTHTNTHSNTHTNTNTELRAAAEGIPPMLPRAAGVVVR